MSRVADLIILNLLCVVCCIPIITIGASITALYYQTLKMVRNEESYIVKGFFHSFRQNFKQSIAFNLIMLSAAVMLYFDMTIVRNMEGLGARILFVIFLMMAVVYLFILLYLYPVLAKFDNTVKNTFVNALLMSIRHLPYTALMLAITAVPVIIFFIPAAQVQSIVLLLYIMMGFATTAYFKSYFLVKIFDNYIPEEAREQLPTGDEIPPALLSEDWAAQDEKKES